MDFPKKQSDLINLVGVISIGVVGALGVYISFVGLQSFYQAEATKVQERREAHGKGNEYRTAVAEQEGKLKGYRWIDAQKQIAAVPIDVAMQAVIADARAGKHESLVPAVGPSTVPTVPAVYGHPPDGAALPAPGTDAAPAAPATSPEAGQDAAAPAGASAPAEAPAPAPNPGGDAPQ